MYKTKPIYQSQQIRLTNTFNLMFVQSNCVCAALAKWRLMLRNIRLNRDWCLSLLLSCEGFKCDFRTFITRVKPIQSLDVRYTPRAERRACRIYSSRTLRFFVQRGRVRPTVNDGFIAGAFHKWLASHSPLTKLYGRCKTINKSIVYRFRGFGVLLGPHVKH